MTSSRVIKGHEGLEKIKGQTLGHRNPESADPLTVTTETEETTTMDILRKTGARWRTYGMNISGWLSQPRKIMNAFEWQSEKELSMELGEMCEEKFSGSTLELTCEADKETTKPLPEKRDRQQRLRVSDTDKCSKPDADQKHKNELNKKIQDGDEELKNPAVPVQRSSSPPPQAEEETVELLQEHVRQDRVSSRIYCGAEVRDVQQQTDELCQLQDQMQQWKLLQKERQELRRTAKGIQETLEAELQEERKIKQLLQEQLEDARLSHQDERARWKRELEEFQRQLEHEVRQRELLQRAYEALKHSLRCSQETSASELQSERNLKGLLQRDSKEATLS